MKHVPKSEHVQDYPNVLAYLDDQPLNDEELIMLDIESKWWRYSGAKEQAIRDRLDWSATYYYLQLSHLLDDPRAMREQPVLVKRLLRLRTQRKRSRGIRGIAV